MYIHNWPLQLFSQGYGVASDTTHVEGVNFIHEWRDGTYRLTSSPNYRFLRNFFMTGLFTLRVVARNLLRGNRQRNIIFFWYFGLMPDLGYVFQIKNVLEKHKYSSRVLSAQILKRDYNLLLNTFHFFLYWDDVIFSDEIKIMLDYHDGQWRVWRKLLT